MEPEKRQRTKAKRQYELAIYVVRVKLIGKSIVELCRQRISRVINTSALFLYHSNKYLKKKLIFFYEGEESMNELCVCVGIDYWLVYKSKDKTRERTTTVYIYTIVYSDPAISFPIEFIPRARKWFQLHRVRNRVQNTSRHVP